MRRSKVDAPIRRVEFDRVALTSRLAKMLDEAVGQAERPHSGVKTQSGRIDDA